MVIFINLISYFFSVALSTITVFLLEDSCLLGLKNEYVLLNIQTASVIFPHSLQIPEVQTARPCLHHHQASIHHHWLHQPLPWLLCHLSHLRWTVPSAAWVLPSQSSAPLWVLPAFLEHLQWAMAPSAAHRWTLNTFDICTYFLQAVEWVKTDLYRRSEWTDIYIYNSYLATPLKNCYNNSCIAPLTSPLC